MDLEKQQAKDRLKIIEKKMKCLGGGIGAKLAGGDFGEGTITGAVGRALNDSLSHGAAHKGGGSGTADFRNEIEFDGFNTSIPSLSGTTSTNNIVPYFPESNDLTIDNRPRFSIDHPDYGVGNPSENFCDILHNCAYETNAPEVPGLPEPGKPGGTKIPALRFGCIVAIEGFQICAE